MKTFTTIAAICAALVAVSTLPASAKERSRAGGYGWYDEKAPKDPSPSARRESHADIRARSADPTGQYRDMPNWAATAFGRGGRR